MTKLRPVAVFGKQSRFGLSALGLTLALAMPAEAAPVEVEFLPPEIPAQDICVEKLADADIIARWENWDGGALPSQDPDQILRDARRLRDLDAGKYFGVVERILDAVAARPGRKTARDIAIDRINLYVKANKIAELRDLGLVEELSAASQALSPKALNILAGLYLDGIVVKKDQERGLQMLVAAAMGGNADSLLRLAKMNLDGQAVPGWELDPRLAVTMAFGALVGKLDPDICDRIGRIAREYAAGEIVAEDNAISEKWYRLAADLGDAGAAWKVSELHLESELIVKDNDVLLKYLQLAADGGVPAAQVQIGELYEAGALLPQDPIKADLYYSQAAKVGSRNALLRLVTLLEPRLADPAARERQWEILAQLIAKPGAPGWAYSKMAKAVLEEKGRWAGEAEAVELLEKGVALEDADSAEILASILLRHRDEPGYFERATDLLGFAVSHSGKIDPMTDLYHAYLCRAPEGANLRMAEFWQSVEDMAGNATVSLEASDIATLDPATDPLTVAALQTHALYGRPDAVAYFLDYIKRNGADPDMLAFWQARLDPVPATVDAVARHALTGVVTPQVLDETLAALKAANAAGLPRAPIDLASVLLDYFPSDAQRSAEAVRYLRNAAAKGSGEAVTRLLALGQEDGVTKADLFKQFGQAIEDRGDADALIFAASVTSDIADKRDYLARAASIMDCGYESTIRLAEAYATSGDVADAEHWLEVSLHLADGNAWRFAEVADQYMTLKGEQHVATALDLYEQAVGLGDRTAFGRLLKIYSDPDTPSYAPAKAVAMFEQLIATSEAADLAAIRARLEAAPAAIRTNVLRQVAWEDVYRKQAEAGDVVAMRELAIYLQENGDSADDARAANLWLERAADGGDAEAMVALAKAYAMGIGFEPSIDRATALLETAAGKGSSEAQKLLAAMTVQREN